MYNKKRELVLTINHPVYTYQIYNIQPFIEDEVLETHRIRLRPTERIGRELWGMEEYYIPIEILGLYLS